MSWNPISNGEIDVRKSVSQGLWQKVKDNFDYLYGKALFDAGILNGSFEIDADNNGVPDNWTVTLYAGGLYKLDESVPAHGYRAFSFTHPGGANNGGGYIESGLYEIADVRTYLIGFILWGSVAGMKNLVHIRYYDKNKNYIGTDDDTLYAASNEGNELIYRSTSNPTTATYFVRGFKPPSSPLARFMSVRLIGGYTDTNVAGTTYFDNISIIPLANAIQAGTIAEGNTSDTNYASIGTVDINVPGITSGALQLDFFSELKASIGTVWLKFGVGSYFTQEISTTSTSYITGLFRCILPHTEISSGKITLTMYLKTESYTGYARKLTSNTSITVIPF